jgi:hypothetical protein
MLLYLRIPNDLKHPDSTPPMPASTKDLEHHAIARHHQAEASKIYQKTRENYLYERRLIL